MGTTRIGFKSTFAPNLHQDIHADIKLFADDILLFSIDDNIVESASKLNSDLMRIKEYTYQWKMSFNLDRTKPAHETILFRKT